MKKIIFDNPNKGLSFLYNTKIGRIILKPVVSNSFINNILGWLLNRRISCLLIKPFIKKYNIKIEDFEKVKYNNFNDFFTRKIKLNKRPIDLKNSSLIAPCDSKLFVYKIDENLTFKVKNTIYSVDTLINDKNMAKEFNNGYALIFRLSPEDYHRYYYIDDGKILKKYKIKGKFHTVNPIIYDKYEVFKENNRECFILETKNFGKIIYVEVGALLVGKIKNHELDTFKKGDEKGYFMYGGSTVILLFKENMVNILNEILDNSNNGYETFVNLGEKIGEKI